MNKYFLASLLFAACLPIQVSAKGNTEFATFLRTKDSLMHIAFYDKDMKAYKQHFSECLAGYNKLTAADKKDFKDYIDDEYYYMACLYASTNDKNNAFANLAKCNIEDYAEEIKKDRNLDNLRKDPRFASYLARAKNKRSEYQVTLQKDAKYNMGEKNKLPAFTYQSANDANLAALKKTFNLDSIAGTGNDVSRIINLMKWVHYLVPHDGSKGNPKTKNAMSLIKECKGDKKTLNCRGLGILLNEVYLAEGFKSRFVTCLPKDTADQDCHVITMVWSASLNKWLWMDPTFMAYVMDEQGTPLSIEEVRERLVNNKTLILNPDANRNHGASQTKNNYLGYYMSKNLYKLECPVSSEYDYETFAEGKSRAYVQLLPGTIAPEPRTTKDKHGVDMYALFYTNNPAVFWAAPTGNTTVSASHALQDYEKAMRIFKDCYNDKQAECAVISESMKKGFWTKELAERLKNQYGTMKSAKLMGMEADNDDVALFMVVCEKSTHCMGVSLNDDNTFGTFRFQTTSNYIDWLLAKAIDKEKKTGINN